MFRPRTLAAILLILGQPLVVGATAWAAPTEREDARTVAVGSAFDVNLTFRTGTGTSWILRGLPPGVALLSETRNRTGNMPGAPAQQVFQLRATRSGDYLLVWELKGGPSEVYEIYRLRLRAGNG